MVGVEDAARSDENGGGAERSVALLDDGTGVAIVLSLSLLLSSLELSDTQSL